MDRREFFNRIAAEWARNDQNLEETTKIENLINLMRLEKGDIVLDAGCGTGRLVPFIRRKIGRSGRLVELDFSEKMLQLARLSHKKQAIYFVLADATLPPFKAQTFDVIICFALFPHLDDKLAGLTEFRRILKAAGSLFIAHPMSRGALNDYHSRVDGPVKGDILPDKAEMKHLLRTAGFKIIQLEDQPSFYLVEAKP